MSYGEAIGAVISAYFDTPEARAARKREEDRRAALNPVARAAEDFKAWLALMRRRFAFAVEAMRGAHDWDL